MSRIMESLHRSAQLVAMLDLLGAQAAVEDEAGTKAIWIQQAEEAVALADAGFPRQDTWEATIERMREPLEDLVYWRGTQRRLGIIAPDSDEAAEIAEALQLLSSNNENES